MFRILFFLIVMMSVVASAAAQTNQNRRSEGRRVTSYKVIKRAAKNSVVNVGPRTTYLKEGLSTTEVVRLLGKPVAISGRNEGGQWIMTYEFPRVEGRRLIAEFANGVLVNSRIETTLTAVSRLN